MSERLKDYPFLQQSFIRHHHRHHLNSSPDRTLSDTSTNMDAGDVQLTSQTPYLGGDRLIGHGDSGKFHANLETSKGSTSDVNEPVAKPNKANKSGVIDHDDSFEDTPEAERASADSTEDEEAVAKVEDPDVKVDHVCAGETGGPCTLGSGDHRKVVSHIFGRNKRCTHQIPDDCWIKYCRKHYQRQKYRCPADWFETQLTLVDEQIDKMEAWGGITSWTIAIRKKEREILDTENAHLAQHNRLPDGPHSRERFLLPYLGSNKTFDEIRELINVINRECDSTGNKTLPSFELLPAIDERRNPRPKRLAAARRAGRVGSSGAPSTFRLSTDPQGQVVKTEAPAGIKTTASAAATPSRSPSITAIRVPHRRKSQLANTGNDEPRAPKRSASIFDEPGEKHDTEHERPAKRQASATEKEDEEADAGFQGRVMLSGTIFDDEDKDEPSTEYDRPVKHHRRSHSF
ncbi:MAG: hypothetical protein L6R39_006252 [Caloplaca ligustica]|nr:MAG: hypothetical protein L6R39_006252 [Caloplaca ligustica]